MNKTSEVLDCLVEKVAESKMNTYGKNYMVLNEDGVEKNENRTRIMKDRLLPGVRNQAIGLAAGALGASVGAGAGLLANKAARTTVSKLSKTEFGANLGKQIGKKGTIIADRLSKRLNLPSSSDKLNPAKLLFSDEYKKARAVSSAASGAAMLAPGFKETGKILDRTKNFEDRHMRTFGTQPTEAEYMQAASLNPTKKSHRMAHGLFNTPDALIKSKRRDISLSEKINNDTGSNNSVYNPQQPTPHSSGVFHALARSKKAYEKDNFLEKVANLESKIGVAKKYVPKVAGGLGATLAGGGAGIMSSKFIDDDNNKCKKLKIGAGIGAGALIGGATGYKLGQHSTDIADGVYKKLLRKS